MAVVALLGAGWMIGRSFDGGPLPPNLAAVRSLPVTLADGRRVPLGQMVKPGLPTIVSVWASWCGPCAKEAPKLAGLRRRFGASKINFLYLNAREPGSQRDKLDAFVDAAGLSRSDYAIMDDAQLTALTNDRRNAIPRTYVFDRTGAPIAMIVGYKPLALARVDGLLS